mgnify:CR=1 FL=1
MLYKIVSKNASGKINQVYCPEISLSRTITNDCEIFEYTGIMINDQAVPDDLGIETYLGPISFKHFVNIAIGLAAKALGEIKLLVKKPEKIQRHVDFANFLVRHFEKGRSLKELEKKYISYFSVVDGGRFSLTYVNHDIYYLVKNYILKTNYEFRIDLLLADIHRANIEYKKDYKHDFGFTKLANESSQFVLDYMKSGRHLF